MLFMCLRIISIFYFVNTIFRKFTENLQILSVLSHTYIRKPNESNEQLLLCLWQSDHHLEQVAVRDNLHITILQFRQALGYG